MRDRLIELLEELGVTVNVPDKVDEDGCGTYTIEGGEYVADHLLANGVIVPPCKVGDTVYRLEKFVWKSDCEECEHFDEGWYDCPDMCGKTSSMYKSPECIEIKEETITHEDILRYLHYKEFGKTVFLTKEEAEAALKGGEG